MENLQILTQIPIFNLQIIISGILIGAIFALAAYGMALVWGVMNIINLTQGEFVMLGGYIAIYLYETGFSPLFGVPLAFVILYIFGWLLYRLVIFRIVDKDMFISILATFGLSILLQQLANQVFGADIRTAQTFLPTYFFFDGTVSIGGINLIAFGIAICFGVILMIFLKSSKTGQAIRATAQNARAARIMGINTDKVYAITYALNAAICGTAGSLVAMIWVIHPYFGLVYTVRAFTIAIVAGLGNLLGIIISGMGLGIAESYAAFILGTELQTAFLFSLLVVILVSRNLMLRRKRRYLR